MKLFFVDNPGLKTCVVCPWDIDDITAEHTLIANQDVLEVHIECVSDM